MWVSRDRLSAVHLHVLEVTWLVVDANFWGRDPGGVLAALPGWFHETLNEGAVVPRRQPLPLALLVADDAPIRCRRHVLELAHVAVEGNRWQLQFELDAGPFDDLVPARNAA